VKISEGGPSFFFDFGGFSTRVTHIIMVLCEAISFENPTIMRATLIVVFAAILYIAAARAISSRQSSYIGTSMLVSSRTGLKLMPSNRPGNMDNGLEGRQKTSPPKLRLVLSSRYHDQIGQSKPAASYISILHIKEKIYSCRLVYNAFFIGFHACKGSHRRFWVLWPKHDVTGAWRNCYLNSYWMHA
jgi:hypothetical protein